VLLELLKNDKKNCRLYLLQSWIIFCPRFNLNYVVENIVGWK